MTTADGVITAVNPMFVELTGASGGSDLVGTQVEDLGSTVRDRALINAALSDDHGWPVHLAIRSGSDGVVVVRLAVTGVPTAGPAGSAQLMLMFEDVHELAQLRETFHHQSLHDPLTGLANGAHFRSNLETILADPVAERVAVLIIDIDGFTVVNDGLGNEAADLVLRRVAGTLRQLFADHRAFVSRLFGDRFAVALRGRSGDHPENAQDTAVSDTPKSAGAAGQSSSAMVIELAENIIQELAKPMYVDRVGVGVSASIGIFLTDSPADFDDDEVMRSAEIALHRAKTLGKAQWVLFDPHDDGTDRDRYRLAAGIAGALELGEIKPVYQPHVVLPDAQVISSLAATLVWDHPTHGVLRVDEIYPLAEMTGMSVPLGKFLLAEAVQTGADWYSRHGEMAPGVCLNLPRRMAVDADLVGIVLAELARNELKPQHLMLCDDAASLVDRRGDLIESLSHLARLGVRFIVNVTGLPDIEVIAAWQLPVPGVMLTGPVVAALTADDPPDPASRSIRQIVQRAEELGIKVGAHGVETQAHATLLCHLGVVVAAGSYQPEYLTRSAAEVWVGHAIPAC